MREWIEGKKPSEKLSATVRDLCKRSLDSKLAHAAGVLADCFDEVVAQTDRLFEAIKKAEVKK